MSKEGLNTQQNQDFTQGSMAKTILRLAVPMTVAQFVNLLYNIVDRMFIGHLPQASSQALAGLGLVFPIITIIIAFANLFGLGGSPLFSIARGAGRHRRAERILGNTFALLATASVLLTTACLLFKEPLLLAFGASKTALPYADAYITTYLFGSPFVMISLGMNNFINAQGFARRGMFTVLIGAVLNLLLDPLFLFVLNMGVQGAALATVLSQFVSAVWVVAFFVGKKAVVRLRLRSLRLRARLVGQITGLGLSGFVMSVTNGAVQAVCNITLQQAGGDLYISVMAVLNSVREVLTQPLSGITSAAGPVLGYNYGAGEGRRVWRGIRFVILLCIGYSLLAWLALLLFPKAFIHIFNSDPALLTAGVPAMNLYFCGIFLMALQFSGQSVFVALGKSKQAVFFSLLRKAVIVIPLTMLLPTIGGLGVNGVFLAEPISNLLGGGSCFVTMLVLVRQELRQSRFDNSRQL